MAQIIGTLTNVVFIFVAAWVFFKVMDTVMGMRVSPEVELEGLDVPEMGAHGYPEIQGPSTMARHLPSAGSAFAQPQVAPLGMGRVQAVFVCRDGGDVQPARREHGRSRLDVVGRQVLLIV